MVLNLSINILNVLDVSDGELKLFNLIPIMIVNN